MPSLYSFFVVAVFPRFSLVENFKSCDQATKRKLKQILQSNSIDAIITRTKMASSNVDDVRLLRIRRKTLANITQQRLLAG